MCTCRKVHVLCFACNHPRRCQISTKSKREKIEQEAGRDPQRLDGDREAERQRDREAERQRERGSNKGDDDAKWRSLTKALHEPETSCLSARHWAAASNRAARLSLFRG